MAENDSRVEFAIFTPLVEEWDAVRARLEDQEPAGPGKVKGRIGTHSVLAVLSGRGESPTGVEIIRVSDTEDWNPRWILLVGIAGGLGRTQLGDVVVASKVLGYDFGKVEDGVYTTRRDLDYSPDPALLQHAQVLAKSVDSSWAETIVAPRPDGRAPGSSRADEGYVASGDKVIDDMDHDFVRDLRKLLPEIDAVEMEAAGAGVAIRELQSRRAVGTLMIRGVSDLPERDLRADEHGKDQRAEWKRYAADAAAAFAATLIESWPEKQDLGEHLFNMLLDSGFQSITEMENAREGIETAFGIRLKVTPVEGAAPPIIARNHLDPMILVEARLERGRAFGRHVPMADPGLLDLYHPPDVYGDMLERLQRDKVLFICGEAGVGKSLGALKLVRQFFDLGVRPYVPPLPEASLAPWEKLGSLEAAEILLLDDPLGKTQYRPLGAPDRRLDPLLAFMDTTRENEETGYLLVSTRTNVLDAFLASVDDDTKRRILSVRLLLDARSYSATARRELVTRYAEAYDCAWYRSPSASVPREAVVDQVAEQIKLPLSISHFCMDERAQFASVDDVAARIRPYASEPSVRLRTLLDNVTIEQTLYLVFAKYLQNAFLSEKELGAMFSEIAQEAGLDGDWQARKREFKSWHQWEDSGRCRITHPSIGESVDAFFEREEKAYAEVDRVVRWGLGHTKDTYQATSILALGQSLERLDAAWEALLGERDQVASELVRMTLGQVLALNLPAQGAPARAFCERWLSALLDDPAATVRGATMTAIYGNLGRAGRELQDRAAALVDDPDGGVRRQLAWAIASNFERASRSEAALRKLALEDPESWVRQTAGEAIMDNFERVDNATRALVRDLAEHGPPAIKRAMLGALEANFTEATAEFQNLYLELAKDQDLAVVEWAIWCAGNKYRDLHDAFERDLHEHLQAFARHPDPAVRKWLAESLGENVHDLDDACQAIFRRLIEDRSQLVREAAASCFVVTP